MWPLLLACAGPAADSAPDSPLDSPAPQGVELSEVSWSIAVDLDGIEVTEDASALFEGLDGAEIELTEAWVTLYVLVLEPCEAVALAPGWSLLPRAYAHGLPSHASTLSVSVAVDLLTAGERALETLSFTAGRFCDVGLALLRADGTTEGLPEDGRLDDATLSLSGRWRPEGGEWQALSMQSALPTERDLPLETEESALTLSLHPASMFHAAELDGDPSRAALSVLEALAAGATVSPSEAR